MTDKTTAERWYMLNKDGMATLCADKADAEQEAIDAQAAWPGMGPHRAVQLVEAGASLPLPGAQEAVATADQGSSFERMFNAAVLDLADDGESNG